MTNNEILTAIENDLLNRKDRSAWDKGVTMYALDLINDLECYGYDMGSDDYMSRSIIKNAMLNGAGDWANFSWSGCSLVYNSDICDRLCNNTEKIRTGYGDKAPNRSETWLDVQTRALYQAENRIMRTWRNVVNPDR